MKTPRRVIGSSLLALLIATAMGSLAGSAATGVLDWEVISRRPHDSEAFTQGLVLDGDGRLFESTGDYGRSTLREVDPHDGQILRSAPLSDESFGEGLAVVGDRLLQLSWRNGVAYAWGRDTFELLETFEYEGEGWGLCHDGHQLVMSDGSDRLTFRDDRTFQVTRSVAVTLDGEPLDHLNELECVHGSVWANVWGSDTVVRIDPGTGIIDGQLDLAGIIEPHPRIGDDRAVLNGIAYDSANDTFLVTGKHWPELIEIRIDHAG